MIWKTLTAQIKEKIYYLLVCCELFPEEQKGCYRWTRRAAGLLYTDQHILKESREVGKSSHGVDWLQKGLWYGLTTLDNRLSENKQNIRQNHKIHQGSHAKLENGINSERKNFSRGVNPKRSSRKCAFAITICNSNGTTQSHIWEMHWGLQITRKDLSPYVHERHQAVCKKTKRKKKNKNWRIW